MQVRLRAPARTGSDSGDPGTGSNVSSPGRSPGIIRTKTTQPRQGLNNPANLLHPHLGVGMGGIRAIHRFHPRLVKFDTFGAGQEMHGAFAVETAHRESFGT